MRIKTIEEIIEKYPKIFEDYVGNPFRINWTCPTGWLDTLDDLCGCIQYRVDNYRMYNKEGVHRCSQVTCSQVKEKFGGLRFYTNGTDHEVSGMIDMAEYLCRDTCMNCGSRENVTETSGWIVNLCKTCMDEYNNKRSGS